jgi:hypothetical protein
MIERIGKGKDHCSMCVFLVFEGIWLRSFSEQTQEVRPWCSILFYNHLNQVPCQITKTFLRTENMELAYDDEFNSREVQKLFM